MQRTRLLLIEVPPILKEIIVGSDEGLSVVGELRRGDDVAEAIEATSADVIVCTEEAAHEVPWRAVLDERARLRVLTVARRGRAVALHELVARDSFLDGVSATQVREILRGARPPADASEENP